MMGAMNNGELTGPGRPTKRGPVLEAKIFQALESALPYRAVCGIAGISVETLRLWRRDDREFDQRCELAEARAIENGLTRIKEVGGDDWRSTAWTLERRFREEFAAPPRAQVNQLWNLTGTTPEGSANVLSANADAIRQLLAAPALGDNEEGFPPGTKTGEQADEEGLP
jgi:hypothetical protein